MFLNVEYECNLANCYAISDYVICLCFYIMLHSLLLICLLLVLQQAVKHVRDLVWTSYRLLLLDPKFFSSRWNWCCFLDLVHQSQNLDLEFTRDIRWASVQIICVLLRLPSRTAVLSMKPVECLSCFLRLVLVPQLSSHLFSFDFMAAV